MAKATHKGTCQCCGSFQKLPKGKLSKHGYTTRFGFFEGTCHGAGELPFEQSKDLVEKMIETATAQADQLEAEMNEYLASKSPDNIKMETVVRRGWGNNSYQMRTGKIVLDELIEDRAGRGGDYGRYEFTCDWNEKERASFHNCFAGTLEEVVAKARKHYAGKLESQIRQLRGYVSWQKERLQNWKPAELTPVEAA